MESSPSPSAPAHDAGLLAPLGRLDQLAEVEGVVRALDGLDGLPVEEHPAVFEQAHDALRRALAGAGPA